MINGAEANVLDFGADQTGANDSHAAFDAAWNSIKTTGGTVYIPPGTYLLSDTWECEIDLTGPHNYYIYGTGATLISGTGVTEWTMALVGGYNNFGITVEGLAFDQRNHATVKGAIQCRGTANAKIVRCTIELEANTGASYAAIQLSEKIPNDSNSNCFWTLIDGCTTRLRTGPATYSRAGIELVGQANATKIVNCSFGGVVNAIVLTSQATTGDSVNGVRILDNDFEGVTNCITLYTTNSSAFTPTGCFVAFNRVESVTTFIYWLGTYAAESSSPIVSQFNYLTTGAVTNYKVNPNNYYMSIFESTYYGVATDNFITTPHNIKFVPESTGNFYIQNLGGGSSWTGSHLVIAPYHLWVDASGKLRIKGSAPTSDTDGVVVGTQT